LATYVADGGTTVQAGQFVTLKSNATSVSLVDVIVIVNGWPIIIGFRSNVTPVKLPTWAEANDQAVQIIANRQAQRLFVRK
jgi:hypothetical protein